MATAAARHPRVSLAAATSGATNLLLAVGPIDGVQAVQTAPVVRTVKRVGSLLEPAPDHRHTRIATTACVC